MSSNSIRPSKEGHAYHEAWAARRALELLRPRDGLCAIAVEGLSCEEPADGVTDAATEIADLGLYFGDQPVFAECDKLEVLQFKYSHVHADDPFVASDAKETLEKFAEADAGLIQKHGEAMVLAKASYGLVINRPTGAHFLAAIKAAAEGLALGDGEKRKAGEHLLAAINAEGRAPTDEEKKAASQLTQIETATGLSGAKLQAFCKRLSIRAVAETPDAILNGASRTIADWSAATGARAKLRLRDLCKVVRDKAGVAGEGANLILKHDVLGAFEVDEDELLPAPPSFADVGQIVPRAQLNDAIGVIRASTKPVVVRATAGVGKTVFMQSLANAFSVSDAAVLFDCFGGGNYRDFGDGRHLPRRGLMHIVNELASTGLCDIILPHSDDDRRVLQTARERFRHAAKVLREASPGACLVVLIDAADNAAVEARDRSQPCFATELLRSFAITPEEGVRIVASCWPDREALTTGGADILPYDLEAFTEAEARAFIAARVPDATEPEIATALARSLSNPRVLAHLIAEWDARVRAAESNAPIAVGELIAARVDGAVKHAGLTGADPAVLQHFLAGLTLLPTPIPVTPFASALGVQASEIANFCANLAPLLEQGMRGITFRDEPTETYIRAKYGADVDTVKAIAARLEQAQATSLYAARALPRLLQTAGDADAAIKLALSDVMPAALTSDVAKNELRAARVSAAIAMAAQKQDPNQLVTLLVEMSSLAAINSRGDDYLAAHPDLVYLSADDEALRRVLEQRKGWKGRRHARAAIVRMLYGDRTEALDHARRAYQWIQWYFGLDQNDRLRRQEHPDVQDQAAIPFFLAADGQIDQAHSELRSWGPGFGFEVARQVVAYLAAHSDGAGILSKLIASDKCGLAFAAAALTAGPALQPDERDRLLDVAAERVARLKAPQSPREDESRQDLHEALVISGAMAVAAQRPKDAEAILAAAPITRIGAWEVQNGRLSSAHAHIVIAPITRAWAKSGAVALRDLLPREVAIHIGDAAPADTSELSTAISEATKALKAEQADNPMLRHYGDDAERFSRGDGPRVLSGLQALADELSAPLADGTLSDDATLMKLVAIWQAKRVNQERYRDSPPIDPLVDAVCRRVVFFAMSVRTGFSAQTAAAVIAVGENDAGARAFTHENVFILSRVAAGREAAGKLAQRVATTIETENHSSSRGEGFAGLAHALVLASREEAAAYYLRGLRDLDTIGAGDYALIQELMWLCGALKGAHLDPAHGQRLMNLCAINFDEEPSKFPWGAFAGCAAHGIGPNALGQLSRWDVRGDASFDDTLAPALDSFAEAKFFSVEQTLALLLLDEPRENYGWRVARFIDTLLARTPQARQEEIFLEIMGQLRLMDPDAVSPLALEAIEQIAPKYPELAAHLPDLSVERARSRAQTDVWNDRANYRRPDAREAARLKQRRRDEIVQRATLAEQIERVDPADAASLEAGIDALRDLGALYSAHEEFMAGVRERTPYEKRPGHTAALVAATAIPIHMRLDALEVCVKAWAESSLAVQEMRASLAEPLAEALADALSERQYGFGSYVGQISRVSGKSHGVVAMLLMRALGDHGVALEASSWLELAALISSDATQVSVRDALSRLLDSDAAKLADARFDGAFKDAYNVGADAAQVTAALIWQRLGDPDAALRWRAAHAVRQLVKFGSNELNALAHCFAKGGLGAFGDDRVKPHLHNARLWFLIALARAGLDHPAALAPLQVFLEGVIADKARHHVVMRGFAARALDAIYAWRGGMDSQRAALAKVTQAALPRAERPKDYYWRKDRERAKFDANTFHFNYEFDKYDITAVADLFQLSHAEIEKRLSETIVALDPAVTGMGDGGGRAVASDNWSSRGSGRHSGYGEQLAWHALIAVVSELAETHPVMEGEWSDPWHDWLKDKDVTRQDGRWLSDGTDLYPPIARQYLLRREAEALALPRRPRKVAAAVGVSGSKAKDFVLIDGHWVTPDNVHVTVHSALLPRHGAFRTARRLAIGPTWKLWTPVVKGDDERDDHHADTPLTPWLVETTKEPTLDEFDPFGVRDANERARPAKSIAEAMTRGGDDPFGRAWKDEAGDVVMRALAWGKRRGGGRHETNESASSLHCSAEKLVAFLKQSQQTLFIVVKFNFYPRESSPEHGKRPDNAAAVVLISGVGKVTLLRCRRVRERTRRRLRPNKAERRRRRAEKQRQAEWISQFAELTAAAEFAILEEEVTDEPGPG